MLWVNLIMDSLASLSLATDSPTDDMLDLPPYSSAAHPPIQAFLQQWAHTSVVPSCLPIAASGLFHTFAIQEHICKPS